VSLAFVFLVFFLSLPNVGDVGVLNVELSGLEHFRAGGGSTTCIFFYFWLEGKKKTETERKKKSAQKSCKKEKPKATTEERATVVGCLHHHAAARKKRYRSQRGRKRRGRKKKRSRSRGEKQKTKTNDGWARHSVKYDGRGQWYERAQKKKITLINLRAVPKKRRFNAFVLNKQKYQVGDGAMISPSEPDAAPYIGQILKIEAEPNDNRNVVLTLKWYYRPEETALGRYKWQGEYELLTSDHLDECHVGTVVGPVRIVTFDEYLTLTVCLFAPLLSLVVF